MVLLHSESITVLQLQDEYLMMIGEYSISGGPLSGIVMTEKSLTLAKSDGNLTMYHE